MIGPFSATVNYSRFKIMAAVLLSHRSLRHVAVFMDVKLVVLCATTTMAATMEPHEETKKIDFC